MRANNFFQLAIAVGVSELAGVIGSVFMGSTSSPQAVSGLAWYAGLVKPALNPPAWVFGPVWTTLYALMGVALFLVWNNYSLIRANKRIVRVWKIGIAAFFIQLFLNAIWSFIFFGLHGSTWLTINNIGWAFIVIIALWLAILATTIAFAKISKPAAWLFIPYILWVSFAGYLNYSIWQLNPAVSSGQVACTQEAKICMDGSAVGRTGPNCEFAACPKEQLIRVFSPRAHETIASPLSITGEARGHWFFEASFPIRLYDGGGNEIGSAAAQATGDWMTENFVPFEAALTFQTPKTSGGVLVFEKDNPSGLPENADELKMPVAFSQQNQKTREVTLYYYNPALDEDETGNILCSRKGLAGVKRAIPRSQTPIQDTIKLLLKGKENLTAAERTQGITTEYPFEGFSLKGVALKDGVLTLTFDDPFNKTGGGSCRVGVLWLQIEATAKQFLEVNTVRFLPEELFQP